MRKNELRSVANIQLTNDHHGSHRDKQYRHFVIHKVIHDLFKLKQCPAHWYAFNHNHACSLVLLWKKQKIAAATQMKYMTVIRYFLRKIGHPTLQIDNKSIGLISIKRKNKLQQITPDDLESTPDPIARLLINLQICFGLTLSESFRLIPDIHVRDNSLWLTREITFNSKDRMVPIRQEQQFLVLKSLDEYTNHDQSLISSHGYHVIRHIYRTAIQNIGGNPTQTYRHLYAKQQYHLLSQTFSRHELIIMIMRELGVSSRTTLWNYLRE